MLFYVFYVTDDFANRYTAFTMATPKSSETVESYLNASKYQFTSNVTNRNEDTRYAEPDPLLRPFFQFLLNSTKRKKRNLKHDSRLVENFINYSINDLQNPVHGDSIMLMHTAIGSNPSYKYESKTQYLPVPLYSKIPNPKPAGYDSAQSGSMSDSIYQSSTPNPYNYWQETPLIFPDGNIKPSTIRPSFVSSNYYTPDYDSRPVLADHNEAPTFITPVQFQAPTFITPVNYQGPSFVTPISVTQTPLWDGNPPPTIVIIEDINTEDDSPQSDPIVEQDPGSAGGVAASSPAAGSSVATAAAAAAAATTAGVAAGVATGAGVGIVGVSVGSAVASAGVSGGVDGGGTGGGSSGGGNVVAPTPGDEVQCRVGGDTSNVCSQLITTTSSSSPADSGTSFLYGLISLFTTLNFLGPLVLTFWSMIFPPMSIILTSGIGVVALLFPWLLPTLWFGRQLRPTLNVNQFEQHFDNTNNFHQPYYY